MQTTRPWSQAVTRFDLRPGYVEHGRGGNRREPVRGLSVGRYIHRGLWKWGELAEIKDKERKGKSEG